MVFGEPTSKLVGALSSLAFVLVALWYFPVLVMGAGLMMIATTAHITSSRKSRTSLAIALAFIGTVTVDLQFNRSRLIEGAIAATANALETAFEQSGGDVDAPEMR